MYQKKIPNSNHSLNIQPTDSFVVDLRLPKNTEPLMVKNNDVKKKVKMKSAFLRMRPGQHYNFNFLNSKKSIFSWHFLRNYRSFWRNLWFNRPQLKLSFFYLRRFLYSRSKFKRNLYLNKSAYRHFARVAVWRWRDFKHSAVELKKELKDHPQPESRAEYLVSWYRSLFVFLMALVFIILPFKILAYFKILDFNNLRDHIIGSSFSALDNLASASNEAASLNLDAAGSSFARAAADFSSAQQELNRVNDWLLALASFSNDPKIKLASQGKHFLAAGVAGAALGEHLSAAGQVFLNNEDDKSWGKLIDAFVKNGGLALIDAGALNRELQAVNSENLPEDYRERFLSVRKKAELAESALRSLLESAQAIKDFLGVSQDKRYLLVFQNNAEMRGAGGFFGSYALVDIRDGAIRNLEIPAGGSYDTEAGMKDFVRAPQPLWLVSPRWYFWDANWWPDWPTSARSLMWFYEKSDGPTVDGVISFTPDVLGDLLRITGPIDLQAEYGLTVDADNFWELIQTTVEKNNLIQKFPEEVADIPDSPRNQPKKIIGDLMGKVMERLPQVLTADNLPKLLIALEKNLGAKNIMLYFNDQTLREKVSRYRFDGAMLNNKHDYLLIAHTNIAGQKSDRRMSDSIEHSVQVLADGSVVDTLLILRTHTGLKNEILSGVRNVDWLRVYVPEGSKLLEASGFRAPDSFYFEEPDASWERFPLLAQTEDLASVDLASGVKIYSENGKTVFANWVMTDPGETSVIRLRYRLPFKIKQEVKNINDGWWSDLKNILNYDASERSPFSLLVQKQPGARPATIKFNLSLPSAWREAWNYPQSELWRGNDILDRDLMRAVLLER